MRFNIGDKVRPHKKWVRWMEPTPEYVSHQHYSGKITDITMDWVEVEFSDGMRLKYHPRSLMRYYPQSMLYTRAIYKNRIRISQLNAGYQVESKAKADRESGSYDNPFPDLYLQYLPKREEKYEEYLKKRRKVEWEEPYFKYKVFNKSKVLYLTLPAIKTLGTLYDETWKRRDDELIRDCLFDLLVELLWEKDLFLDSELLRLVEARDVPSIKKILGEREVFKRYHL